MSSLASLAILAQAIYASMPDESDQSGWPLDRFVDKNLLDYVCAICRDICRNAVSINCGHTFCEKCIQRSSHNFKNECPQCRVLITQMVPSFHIRMKIEGLHIMCENNESGCTYTDATSRIKEHEESCPKRNVPCDDCEQNILESELEDHRLNRCTHRKVKCDICVNMVPLHKMEEHVRDLCLLKEIGCEWCSVVMQRFLMSGHLTECPKLVIPCTYYSYGCKNVCERQLMSTHLESVNHIPIICNAFDNKIEEWDRLYLSQLNDGPFRISGHGHLVVLCSDLNGVRCKACRKPMKEHKERFFGYICTNGCPFALCVECFGQRRLYRSKLQYLAHLVQ